jgi:putative inorganic carbon (hco3(-)) transporter
MPNSFPGKKLLRAKSPYSVRFAMRDLLIILIVGIFAIMALRRPWIGVLLWTWLSLMNPHRFAWGIAYSAPLAAIAVGATVLGLLMTQEKQSPFIDAPVKWYFVFLIWLTVSWLLGENVSGDFELWSRFMKISFMSFVAIALLLNRHQIFAFIWITVFSLAILGAKGGIFTVATGGNHRVWGPPSSFIEGNNEFALALVATIPLIRFLQMQMRQGKWRHALTAIMLLCAAAAISSYSRGALLAITAMGGMFWWRSDKKFLFGVTMVFSGVCLLFFMPEQWWSRMDTIATYEEDLSAIGRLNGWIVATQVALHNVLGSGMSYQYQWFFDQWGSYNTNIIAAHSIYFQILGNHGFVGLALFMAIWISCFRSAGWLRKHGNDRPETRWTADLGAMSQVSLIGYGVGGAFLSLAYFDLPYNILVAVVITRKWVECRSWERDPLIGFWEYAGLWRKRASPLTPPGAQQIDTSRG